jgi:hypothetical protein
MKLFSRAVPVCLAILLVAVAAAQWQPGKGPLMTRWAKDVSPENVHPEYPRPQMVRKQWMSLNGLWKLGISSKAAGTHGGYDRTILVPFPVESALSGVMQRVTDKDWLWYKRSFRVPVEWKGKNVRLNFGASDWETTVWVNGVRQGIHQGGYDSFSYDITKALRSGDNEIVVAVWDPTDTSTQPRGKQVLKPGGIFYTPATGIWQTVWLEPVSEGHVGSLRIEPDVDKEQVHVTIEGAGDMSRYAYAEVTVLDGKTTVARKLGQVGKELILDVPEPKLWSPESPFLYGLRVRIWDDRGAPGPHDVRDAVDSYFGMREVSIGRDEQGRPRFLLNGKQTFMVGPLDQGFWPDGIYTAPTDEALRYDIEVTKRLGFNMIRKHVKIEPARWYYWCDKLGIMVWQDMPSGDRSIGGNDPDIRRTARSAEIFERELKAMIDQHRNHPSVVSWVLFNEGWGQYDTERLSVWMKEYDPTRLLDSVTGWTDRGVGDMLDWHVYPGPGSPKPEVARAAVLGEFGGLGLPMPGHMWQEKGWGYRSYKTQEELTDAMVKLFTDLRLLIWSPGLSAAVYTQTTDVETELNGLMPYDRSMIKVDEARITKAIKALFGPPIMMKPLVPTAADRPSTWRYTFEAPPADWAVPGFSDSAWRSGPSGFGTAGTPGAVIGTVWSTPDIWIRRTFTIGKQKLLDPHLYLHHDEDAEVYLDGVLIASPKGYTSSYTLFPLKSEAVALLTPGTHTLAIHCHQTTGGQYIDAGIVDIGT